MAWSGVLEADPPHVRLAENLQWRGGMGCVGISFLHILIGTLARRGLGYLVAVVPHSPADVLRLGFDYELIASSNAEVTTCPSHREG